MKTYPVYHEQQLPGVAEVVHTHRTAWRGWQRGFGALQSWLLKYGAKPLRYVTLHFRRGAVSLLHRNQAVTTVLLCEQKPYPGMILAAAQKLYGNSVNILSVCDLARTISSYIEVYCNNSKLLSFSSGLFASKVYIKIQPERSSNHACF